jgi:hypothetical protein
LVWRSGGVAATRPLAITTLIAIITLATPHHTVTHHTVNTNQDYKVFINPSLSDVVATTTAEALAMGKWVVCAEHPSNKFFAQFPNCLTYRTPDEFSAALVHAMARDPAPLSSEQLRKLTWEDATDRFLEVAELPDRPLPVHEQLLDGVLAAAHQALTGIEPLRALAGAGSKTRDSPARVTDYVPSESDVGGWFDDAARAQRAYKQRQGGSDGAQQQQQVVQLQVQQLTASPRGQQQQGQQGQQGQQRQHEAWRGALRPAGGSATALAEAVAAADAEAAQQEQQLSSEAAEAGGGSGGGGSGRRRWRLRRLRST